MDGWHLCSMLWLGMRGHADAYVCTHILSTRFSCPCESLPVPSSSIMASTVSSDVRLLGPFA